METPAFAIELYAERTPNPHSMKFVANKLLVDGPGVQFASATETNGRSPLAEKLFQFPFITNVFISANFVSVNKIEALEWEEVLTELREFIKDYLRSDQPILGNKVFTQKGELVSNVTDLKPELVNELDIKINNILEEYIRPAVEQDGGAIIFKSFSEGVVTVALQGACSGCPSSRITLKAGIEGLLKRMVPEVQSVIAEEI